tara:strand:+ start:1820 stop:2368 length:549 start_codon:yes stop_codon:yes gene_type:complete
MTSLQIGTNVNSRRVTRWSTAVIQGGGPECQSAPFVHNVGNLHTVNDKHPLGSTADHLVSECTAMPGRKADPEVLATLTGDVAKRPAARLGMYDRTYNQPAQRVRPTSYCDHYCVRHLAEQGAAPAAAPKGGPSPVPLALSGLTAAELERVARFGVLPTGGDKPSILKPVTRDGPAWIAKDE